MVMLIVSTPFTLKFEQLANVTVGNDDMESKEKKNT